MKRQIIDHTPAGAQYVLPGCRRVPEKALAERQWNAPKRAESAQRDAGPLFADDAQQLDLIELLRRG